MHYFSRFGVSGTAVQYKRGTNHDGLIQYRRSIRAADCRRSEGSKINSLRHGWRNASSRRVVQPTLRISRQGHSRVTMISTVSWCKKVPVTEHQSRVGDMACDVFCVPDQTGSNCCWHCSVRATNMHIPVGVLSLHVDRFCPWGKDRANLQCHCQDQEKN